MRNNNGPLHFSREPGRAKSAERRAFEELPTGWKPFDAIHKMDFNDIVYLQKQAFGQAERFDVLKLEHVEVLSKVCNSLICYHIPLSWMQLPL